MNKVCVVANKKAAKGLRDEPVIAVDLGFSGSKRSCGIASYADGVLTPGDVFTFGIAVQRVRTFLQNHPTCVMILEAPLSATFGADGNPVPRGRFESGHRPRWWSINSGAAMCLAAAFFLRRIIGGEEQREDARIWLIEGFVSRRGAAHAADAQALCEAFIGPRGDPYYEITAPRGGEVLSMLRVLKIHDESARPPVVLAPLLV